MTHEVTAQAPRRWILRLLVMVQAAVLPALGIPMFFRNEAGWHYLLWQRTRFLDLFDGFLGPESSMSNAVLSRPLVRVLEWSQVRLFGLHSTNYVVFNGALFVGFALALFQLALELCGAATAVIAILLLMSGFQIVFYPVFNAIYGLQYPLEMLLCSASLLLFARAFAGRSRQAIPAVALALLAFVSHAASAVVIPLAVAAMSLGSRAPGRRHRTMIALVSPLGVLVAFALERSGVPGGLAAQSGLGAQLAFALRQATTLGTLILRPPGGPLLVIGMALVATLALRRDSIRVTLTTFLVAAVCWFLLRRMPLLAPPLLLAAGAIAVARRPSLWFLIVWAAVGVPLYVVTPEVNAIYTRHLVVPLLLLSAEGWRHFLVEVKSLGGAVRRIVTAFDLERAAVVATILLVGVLGLATQVRIPGLSAKLEQLRYVRDLGMNFRDALGNALAEVPPGGSLGFFAGRSRDDEMRSFYGDDYFARLQPAKAVHYDDFTALMGRPDVRVVEVDPETGPFPSQIPVLAVNPWEEERARALCDCDPVHRHQRGRARAALYLVESQGGSASP